MIYFFLHCELRLESYLLLFHFFLNCLYSQQPFRSFAQWPNSKNPYLLESITMQLNHFLSSCTKKILFCPRDPKTLTSVCSSLKIPYSNIKNQYRFCIKSAELTLTWHPNFIRMLTFPKHLKFSIKYNSITSNTFLVTSLPTKHCSLANKYPSPSILFY